MISLKGKVALITGASRGIGRATALRMARAGARVVCNYLRSKEAARTLEKELKRLRAGYHFYRGDMSRAKDVERMFRETLRKFKKLDILVANAGIWKGAPIEEMTEPEWDETMDVNLKSVYLCCHHAARIMKEQRRGTMILVSSTAGQRGEAFHSHYAATKGAVISLTKSLATELGPHGITVNCIAPGWVDTDMSAEPLADPIEMEKILALIPLRRLASADDIAGPILFLASDLARHITGEVLNVNGGSVLCG